MLEPYKAKSITRLKRLTGQLNGILKMVEDDKYCGDIITQLLAAQSGVKGVLMQVLESHLMTCGKKSMNAKSPKVREKFIKEIMKACELSSR